VGTSILLTNDDGIGSPGLAAMLLSLAEWATVYVIAPDSERSGSGCSVTLHDDLESVPAQLPAAEAAWAVSGTPADAVKLGVAELVKDKVDLVVAGINHGPNVGVNVFYSGTVAAAIEAAALGLPAVAVSLEIAEQMDFDAAAALAGPLVRATAASGLDRGFLVNINVPNRPRDQIGPPTLTRHGRAGYEEFYRPAGGGESSAPGARRWRIDGEFSLGTDASENDAAALAQGRISVTPMEIDLTAGSFLADQHGWEFLLDGQERP